LKKTILAALAAAATTMASAQGTVYGVIDQAVRVIDGKSSLVSGSFHTSRIGIKGSEDLGNGLTASFILEGKLNASNGDMSGDQMFNRESSLSIGSNTLGTITLGRTDTSASENIDGIAGFGNFGNFVLVWDVEYAADRANTVRYSSPLVSGAQFQIGQSEAIDSNEKLTSGSLTYKNQILSLGAGYDRTESGNTYKAIGGAVSISGASLGAMYGMRDAETETKVAVVSGRMPLGAFAVHGVHSIKDAGGVESKTSTVGVSYNFSKTTMILAAYQDQDTGGSDFYQIGIKHSF
jgi:predicted porin